MLKYKKDTYKAFGEIITHNPSKGGNNEHAKHTEMYKYTLEFYKLVFFESPPSEVWESLETRFVPSSIEYLKVNLERVAGVQVVQYRQGTERLQFKNNLKRAALFAKLKEYQELMEKGKMDEDQLVFEP